MTGPYVNVNSEQYIFTFPSGSTTSQAIEMKTQIPVGLYIPAGGWNASSIAFRASPTGGTFYPVFMWQNAARLELNVSPTSFVDVPYEKLIGPQWLMLETTYTGSALAQTGVRTITAVTRPF